MCNLQYEYSQLQEPNPVILKNVASIHKRKYQENFKYGNHVLILLKLTKMGTKPVLSNVLFNWNIKSENHYTPILIN
jgi:hypothetical protein